MLYLEFGRFSWPYGIRVSVIYTWIQAIKHKHLTPKTQKLARVASALAPLKSDELFNFSLIKSEKYSISLAILAHDILYTDVSSRKSDKQ